MAHQVANSSAVLGALGAFFAFCCGASFVYICNDILDLEADKKHRSKRNRPLASGALSIRTAAVLGALCLGCAAVLVAFLPLKFGLLLGLYLIISSAYSVRIKALIVADILVLASLYTLRILAGAFAAEVHVSQWLLLFSMFFFLSLACVKRFSELRMVKLGNGAESSRRGYQPEDLELISQCGCASGYLSVLVLALYVSSKEVMTLYSWPQVIYLLCPLLLYWVTRVWLLAHRGEVHDDPIVFALTDRVSYGVGFAALIVLGAAI
jgi:4-hydroxybenzoate polyprenyltransferase